MFTTTIDKLPLLSGESLRFEEDASFKCGLGTRPALYVRGRLRVTNQRIITMQKPLFSKQYVVRHIIYYQAKGPVLQVGDMMGGFFWKGGYITLYIPLDHMMIKKEGKREVVYMDIPAEKSFFLRNHYFVIYTKDVNQYKQQLGLAVLE